MGCQIQETENEKNLKQCISKTLEKFYKIFLVKMIANWDVSWDSLQNVNLLASCGAKRTVSEQIYFPN